MLSERLTWAIEKKLQAAPALKKITKRYLAEIAGVSPSAVGYWFTDTNGIQAEPARKIGAFLGVDPVWLEKNEGSPESGGAAPSGRRIHDDIPGAFRANHNRFRKIPAYGKAMGGMPERLWDEDGGYPVGASDVYAEVASADPNAFMVPIEGISMVPRFNPGEYALVEPNTEPELEDDVLVRLSDGRTMLKRLLSRRGGIRLGSYNNGDIISAPPEEITWMYYVAHPVPARKIKNRM